jgi:AraC-like DNA-binding protein
MEIDIIKLIKDIMNTQGIDCHIFAPHYETIAQFDGGLRNQLYENYDYNDIVRQLENSCEANTLYQITDPFNVHYVAFKVPAQARMGQDSAFAFIGPYLFDTHDAMVSDIIEKNKLPLFHISELKKYYYSVPVVADRSVLDAQIVTFAGHLFGGGNQFEIIDTSLRFENTRIQADYRIDAQNALSMAAIEALYGFEDELLEAIEQGNLKKAIQCHQSFTRYRLEPRFADKIREQKNYLIVLNTMFRKAVQKADVHPAHIDSVSASFAKRIEAVRDTSDLTTLLEDMRRKYCLLVQNHSLRGYSHVTQRIINYIDFNLIEPLSLNHIAGIFSMNPSYLSSQFKKETGKTITDYIIERRIQGALFLLATTDLPIQTVAEKVGFFDENYFSRTFKKVQHKTPREYRKALR